MIMQMAQSEPAETKMEVLMLGNSRTGTQSLKEALRILGIPDTYHMTEYQNQGHQDRWLELLRAKYETMRTISKEELEELYHGYGAVADVPSCMFADDLMDAYPEARVILNTRPADEWVRSFGRTIWSHWEKVKDSTVVNPVTGESRRVKDTAVALMFKYLWGDDFAETGRDRFLRHDNWIRELAANRGIDILEYNIKQGWKPLCDFLGKPVPSVELPFEDNWFDIVRGKGKAKSDWDFGKADSTEISIDRFAQEYKSWYTRS